MQRPRDDFLAGPGIADDQRIGIRCPDRADPVAEIHHDLGPAGQARLQVVPLARHGPETPVFEHQAAPVHRPTDDAGEMLGGERLLQEVVGSLPHRLDRQLHVAVPGDQDDRDFAVEVADPMQERHPVRSRHPDIRHHNAIEAVAEKLEHMVGIGEGDDGQPIKLERLRRRPAQLLLVVHQKDTLLAHSAALRTSVATSSSMRKTAPPSG